LGPAPDMRTIK